MKNLIAIFLMGILSTAYTQTMRITYFRAAETKSNINLYWQTFVEDGQDTFKIYRSINSDKCDYAEENWELLNKMYTTLTVKEKVVQTQVFCVNNIIYITDRDYQDSFDVYDINNRKVLSDIDNGQQLDMLPRGIYIIKSDKQSIKVVNQ